MALSVKLDVFEGPLDLLLHLIQKHKIDIFDIPIHFITERFLDALADLAELDLDRSGEFLVMAATLAQIKSRMLLPVVDPGEPDETVDPRADLVARLLEYQQYKELAGRLDDRSMLGRNVFTRPVRDEESAGTVPAEMAPVNLFELVEVFESLKRRAGFRPGLRVRMARRSVREEMDRIARLLASSRRLLFSKVVETDRQGQLDVVSLVGSLLAVLELTRRGLIRISQSARPGADLWLSPAVADLESEVAKLRE